MSEQPEAHFRKAMRELAVRGGAATRRRAARYPDYYKAIGRIGGLASANARRNKNAGERLEETPPQTFDHPAEAVSALEPAEAVSLCESTREGVSSAPGLADAQPEFIDDITRLADKLAAALADLDRTT